MSPLTSFKSLRRRRSFPPLKGRMVASSAISVLALLASLVSQDVVYAQRRTPSVFLGGGNGTIALIPQVGKHSSGLTAFELGLQPNRFLHPRQSGCPSGYGPCQGDPTSCCPIGGACCLSQNGTCNFSSVSFTHLAFV